MAEICARLEGAGALGDLTEAPGLLKRLEVEFARARSSLGAEVSYASNDDAERRRAPGPVRISFTA